MSRVVAVDPRSWADRAVGAVRGLVGSADQRPAGAGGPGRSLVVTIYGLVYAIFSFPAGVLADRMNRKVLLGIGLMVYSATTVQGLIHT